MERRLAIIDLGSNTCRLVLFAYTPPLSFRLFDQVSERVRIGEGMFPANPSDPEALRGPGGPRGENNRLQPEPMARAVQLLKMFRGLCEANAIERVIATATSAVRDAVNREEFLERVEREAGLQLCVLSEREEAYYAYLGVVNSLPLTEGLVVDLGGGSLELTRVRDRLHVVEASLPLGVVRLTEQYLHGDPIKPREARALAAYIEAQLEGVRWLRSSAPEQVVVLGGTMRALARMDQRRRAYPLDRLHGYPMSRRVVREWAEELLTRSLADRAKIKGLKGERADVIPAGAVVIAGLMNYLDAPSLIVSGQGLREGLFYEEFLREAPEQQAPQTGLPHLPPGITHVPLIADLRAFGIANVSAIHNVDRSHGEHVCSLALTLFDQLHSLHHYGSEERELLNAASRLHDIGVSIDYYRHHLHSAYLIENADLPGFTQREIALIALLVRWHRHGSPDVEPFGAMLRKGDIERVQKLSAILRLAEDLERSRARAVQDVKCRVLDRVIEVQALTQGGAEAELWAANRDSGLFEEVYGLALRVTARIPARDLDASA